MGAALEEHLIGEFPLVAAVVAPASFGAEAASTGSDAETRKRQSCTGGAAGSCRCGRKRDGSRVRRFRKKAEGRIGCRAGRNLILNRKRVGVRRSKRVQQRR